MCVCVLIRVSEWMSELSGCVGAPAAFNFFSSFEIALLFNLGAKLVCYCVFIVHQSKWEGKYGDNRARETERKKYGSRVYLRGRDLHKRMFVWHICFFLFFLFIFSFFLVAQWNRCSIFVVSAYPLRHSALVSFQTFYFSIVNYITVIWIKCHLNCILLHLFFILMILFLISLHYLDSI